MNGETVELFSGTASFSKVALENQFNILTIDNNPKSREIALEEGRGDFHYEIDIMDWNGNHDLHKVDFLWASPPCQAFSIASCSKHFNKEGDVYTPKSPRAREGLRLLDKSLYLIGKIVKSNGYWFIENPRGLMRKIIDDRFKLFGITDYRRNTVSYCKYGDNRMKPTDIWTNADFWTPRKMCHNYRYDKEGNILNRHCHHEAAQRGAKTGTQGLKNAMNRSVIPPELFREIFSQYRLPKVYRVLDRLLKED